MFQCSHSRAMIEISKQDCTIRNVLTRADNFGHIPNANKKNHSILKEKASLWEFYYWFLEKLLFLRTLPYNVTQIDKQYNQSHGQLFTNYMLCSSHSQSRWDSTREASGIRTSTLLFNSETSKMESNFLAKQIQEEWYNQPSLIHFVMTHTHTHTKHTHTSLQLQ